MTTSWQYLPLRHVFVSQIQSFTIVSVKLVDIQVPLIICGGPFPPWISKTAGIQTHGMEATLSSESNLSCALGSSPDFRRPAEATCHWQQPPWATECLVREKYSVTWGHCRPQEPLEATGAQFWLLTKGPGGPFPRRFGTHGSWNQKVPNPQILQACMYLFSPLKGQSQQFFYYKYLLSHNMYDARWLWNRWNLELDHPILSSQRDEVLKNVSAKFMDTRLFNTAKHYFRVY